MNELRRDPMSGRWTIIEKREKIDFETLIGKRREKSSQKTCPFCEGNEQKIQPEIYSVRKPGSHKNSPGWQVRVVPDPFPILETRGPMDERGYGIFDVLNGIGVHEVIIEHPLHFKSFSDFSIEHYQRVIEVMQNRIIEIKKDIRFRYVLIHKNYGEASADFLEHSHSHVLATPITPRRVKSELDYAKDYYEYKERCIYCDMLYLELDKKERNIIEDGDFLVIAPFASRRPFEIWILPEQHETFFEQNTNQRQLAETIIMIMTKISKLLKNPDYIITLHNGPNITAAEKRGYWKTVRKDYHWHIEIVPRLHSSTSFELGSGFSINPVAPEIAAKILRDEKIEF